MSDAGPTKRPDMTHSMLPYQPIAHAPERKRVAAVVAGATGIVSTCIGCGMGVVAIAAVVTGNFGIAAAVSLLLSAMFLVCAVILFRQANHLWGWVG